MIGDILQNLCLITNTFIIKHMRCFFIADTFIIEWWFFITDSFIIKWWFFVTDSFIIEWRFFITDTFIIEWWFFITNAFIIEWWFFVTNSFIIEIMIIKTVNIYEFFWLNWSFFFYLLHFEIHCSWFFLITLTFPALIINEWITN